MLMVAKTQRVAVCSGTARDNGCKALLHEWVLVVLFLLSFRESYVTCRWLGIVVIEKFGWRLIHWRPLLSMVVILIMSMLC